MSVSNPQPAPGEIPASPDAAAESAEAEALAASGQGGDDPLLWCLAFLCRYYERPRSPDVLKAGLPDAGQPLTPALTVRAAERAGLSARVVKRRFTSISGLLLPAVLLLKDGGACVLVEYTGKGKALVVMPESGSGVQETDLDQLRAGYLGYAIFVRPEYHADRGDRYDREGRPKHWFLSALRGNWWIYGQVAMAALLVNVFSLASPLFIMTVYDRVIPNTAIETLWVLAIGAATVFVFDFIVRTLRTYYVEVGGRRADVVLAGRLFDQVLDMQLAARSGSAGDLANTMREFESLRDFFTSATLIAIVDLPFVFFFVAVVWLIAGPLAIILAITVPLVLIAGLIIQIPLGAAVRSGFRDAGSKHGVLIETIGGLETIKSVGAEGRMRRQWEEAVASSARSGVRARSLSLLGLNLTITMQQVATIALVVFGVLLISNGGMTVGALIAVVILGGRAMAPLAQVAQLLTRLHQARTSFRALDRIMRAPVERSPSREFVHRPRLLGDITFRDLSFSYPGQDIEALKGLSFAIKAGEKVGLIGRVGSGKSTVAKLLLGLYQPADGAVLVDGTDLRQIDPANLRRNIGCVPQDVVLFRGTVRENLVIGAPQAEDPAVLQAAKQSGVEEFVAQHPMGYDLPVGERGEGLSGGQRQALALARALLLDPPILILDEPTSAMDNRSEEMLKTNLTAIAADKTLLLITHRSSLLTLVDRLLVMDGGRLVADGPKQAVLDAIADGRISVMA